MESDWVSIPIQRVDSHLHPSINPPMDPLWCWRLWSVLWSDKDGGRNTETKATTRARHEGPQKLRRNVSIMQWKMKMRMLNDDAMEVQLQFETTCQATDHAYLMTIPMLTNPGMFWATANIKFNDNKKFTVRRYRGPKLRTEWQIRMRRSQNIPSTKLSNTSNRRHKNRWTSIEIRKDAHCVWSWSVLGLVHTGTVAKSEVSSHFDCMVTVVHGRLCPTISQFCGTQRDEILRHVWQHLQCAPHPLADKLLQGELFRSSTWKKARQMLGNNIFPE